MKLRTQTLGHTHTHTHIINFHIYPNIQTDRPMQTLQTFMICSGSTLFASHPGIQAQQQTISGRERMTVENISWLISTKECCRPRRGFEPVTSWSPVGWRIQLSHRGRHDERCMRSYWYKVLDTYTYERTHARKQCDFSPQHRVKIIVGTCRKFSTIKFV